jgi:hypothetical protein
MPEITNKSDEQKVAEAEVDSFRKEHGRMREARAG